MDSHPRSPVSNPVISNFWNTSRSTWLASDMQQTPMWSKLSLPGYKYRQYFLYFGLQAFVHGETNAELSATHVLFTHRSWNKVFGTTVCLPCFLKLRCTVRTSSWKSLGFSCLFYEHQYACVLWKCGDEKCTWNFSLETSSKEIILDTQACRQIRV